MILNKENTFTEQNRFLVYSDQLNDTRRQILDTAEEMISRSAIQTFEDEGETITATDASYLAGLTVDGKAVQDGTPTPSNPVDVQVVQGINVWDEVWEVGGIDLTTGQNIVVGTQIRSKNYIPIFPDTNYYFCCNSMPSASNPSLRFYDSDKNYIGYYPQSGSLAPYNTVFKTPTNAHYMRFANQPTYGTVYKDDVCINVSNVNVNGLYIPYGSIGLKVGSTITPIDLNGNVLASLPDGTKDVLTVDSVGHCVLEKHHTFIDANSNLTWSSSATTHDDLGYMQVAVPNQSTTNLINARLHNLSNYLIGTTNFSDATSDEFTCNGSTVFWRYKLNGQSPTVENGLARMRELGAYFYVGLATPQTIDLGFIDMPAIPDGSTISITAQVTPTIAVKWWTKNQSDVAAAFSAVSSDLATLQGEISALDARVTALESANAKTLVLEKLETSKEVADGESIEQEEMNLDE